MLGCGEKGGAEDRLFRFVLLCRSVAGDGGTFQVQCLQFHPRDTDHLYAGTDTVRMCLHSLGGQRKV